MIEFVAFDADGMSSRCENLFPALKAAKGALAEGEHLGSNCLCFSDRRRRCGQR